jgi:hypothetical protein
LEYRAGFSAAAQISNTYGLHSRCASLYFKNLQCANTCKTHPDECYDDKGFPDEGNGPEGYKKKGLLFRFVDLHPHLFIQRRDFVSLAGMLGYLIIQILYIGCGCLKFAVHTDILAFKRYHGFSPAVYMIGYIFIHFCTFQKP